MVGRAQWKWLCLGFLRLVLGINSCANTFIFGEIEEGFDGWSFGGLVSFPKNKNTSSDITALENQVDQLVCQLYEMTEEEIKIIENV